MFKCNNCDKTFATKSKLERHKNRLTPCKKEVIALYCKICDIEFKYQSILARHEKSEKHIKNTKKDNVLTNDFNNLNRLFHSMNIFSETNIDVVENEFNIDLLSKVQIKHYDDKIKEYYEDDEIPVINYYKAHSRNQGYVTLLLSIFKDLNFNIKYQDNTNCRIIIFYNSVKDKNTNPLYLILEKDHNDKYYWQKITFENFLIELFNLMDKINNKFNFSNFNIIMNHINKYVRNNEHFLEKCGEDINSILISLGKRIDCVVDTTSMDFNKEMQLRLNKELNLYDGERVPFDLKNHIFEIYTKK